MSHDVRRNLLLNSASVERNVRRKLTKDERKRQYVIGVRSIDEIGIYMLQIDYRLT